MQSDTFSVFWQPIQTSFGKKKSTRSYVGVINKYERFSWQGWQLSLSRIRSALIAAHSSGWSGQREKGVRATSSEPDLTFSNCPSPTIRHSLNYRLQLSRPTLKTTSQRMPDRARSIIQPKLIKLRRCLTSCHDLLKHLELSGCVKGHEVHATIPAEIPSVEPVPVLQERELALLG